MTKPKMLKFKLITRELGELFKAMNNLNEKEWMGKEPRTCKIKDIKQKQPVPMGSYAEFDVVVEHRPKGTILFDGRGWIWDGFTPKHIDATNDGRLLDGKGNPLPAGQDPILLEFKAYRSLDFNDYDFGKFLSEEECESSEGL